MPLPLALSWIEILLTESANLLGNVVQVPRNSVASVLTDSLINSLPAGARAVLGGSGS